MIEECGNRVEESNKETKIGWLIIIAKKTFDKKNEIKMQPSWLREIDSIQILKYLATNEQIDKLASDLLCRMSMSLPSDRAIMMIIDYKGILWQSRNNKITSSN